MSEAKQTQIAKYGLTVRHWKSVFALRSV